VEVVSEEQTVLDAAIDDTLGMLSFEAGGVFG
jgi:hypothetical protein